MARRGTVKRNSLDQENFIARIYEGVRSPSSGAAETDAGDVRTKQSLIECKTTGTPGKEPKPQLPRFVRWLEKVALEAWEEGRDPMLALRYYAPESPLATPDGWVDLSVRPILYDVAREKSYENEKERDAEVH